jgi:hypothetical protein
LACSRCAAAAQPLRSQRHAQQAAWSRPHAPFLARRIVDDLPSRRSLRCWSRKQVKLMTSELGRSFVVGYGDDGGPRFIHHRASSCGGDGSSACNWDTYWSDLPNGEALIGALVSGPSAEEEYRDSRLDYIQNLVSIEYNAGGRSPPCACVQAPGQAAAACSAACGGASAGCVRPCAAAGPHGAPHLARCAQSRRVHPAAAPELWRVSLLPAVLPAAAAPQASPP